MNIESISDDTYNIYISNFFRDNSFNIDNIGDFIKSLLILLKRIYNIKLKGFYNVCVYINKKVGFYIKMEKQNKYDLYMEEIDLKITVYEDSKVYYKTTYPDNILEYIDDNTKYQDGYFFLDFNNIELSDKEMLKLVEFGRFIFQE